MNKKDLTKTEQYLRENGWEATTTEELKNSAKIVGKELIKANLKMIKSGTMSKNEAMEEIKKLDNVIEKI
jgi:enolase